MKVLVTGAAGRVGTGVRRDLAGRHWVRSLDLVACEADECVVGDFMDAETRTRSVEGVEAIIHLAFFPGIRDPSSSFTINVLGTYLLLETAQALGVPRVVYASSLSVYSRPQWNQYRASGAVAETVIPEPDDVYGFTKYLGEEVCRRFARQGLRCTLLRLTGVARPEDWHLAVARRQAGATHVDDVAQAFRLALETDPPAGTAPVYHICGDHPNKVTPIDRARAALGFEPRYNIGQ